MLFIPEKPVSGRSFAVILTVSVLLKVISVGLITGGVFSKTRENPFSGPPIFGPSSNSKACSSLDVALSSELSVASTQRTPLLGRSTVNSYSSFISLLFSSLPNVTGFQILPGLEVSVPGSF